MIDPTLEEGFRLCAASSDHKNAINFLKLAIKDNNECDKRTEEEFKRLFWQSVKRVNSPDMKREWRNYLKKIRMVGDTVIPVYNHRALNDKAGREAWNERHRQVFGCDWKDCERCAIEPSMSMKVLPTGEVVYTHG